MTTRLDLAQGRSLLDLSEAELLERLGATSDDVQRDVAYEKLEHVDAVYRADAFPGWVFLRDGRPQIVYVPEGPALESWTPAELRAELGEPAAALRSRVGKTFNHYVYPSKGIAYSSDGAELALVEFFRPRSLEEYEREIYRDPGAFIK